MSINLDKLIAEIEALTSVKSKESKMVYVSHPYGGKEENKIKIENIIKRLSKKYNSEVFISPVHSFGFMYDCFEYERGLQMCLDLLDRCDSMLVFGDWEHSRGCKAEVKYAKEYGIPYQIVSDVSRLL